MLLHASGNKSKSDEGECLHSRRVSLPRIECPTVAYLMAANRHPQVQRVEEGGELFPCEDHGVKASAFAIFHLYDAKSM
jgi:hypothetical protein